jgi:hypothetical protein
MTQVNPTFYNVVTYAGKGDNRRIEITDTGLNVIARVAFNGRFKALSGQAVRLLLECVNLGRFESTSLGYSSNTVNELLDPWKLGNPGAILHPDSFQSWESDNESFLGIDNPKFLPGNWVTTTHYGEMAAILIVKELSEVTERIRDEQKLTLVA